AAMTATVKTMDSQRWICRTHLFQFNGTSSENEPEAERALRASIGSLDPCEQLDELLAHQFPAVARAAEFLFLVRPEARLHEGQARARGRGREREGHDGVDVHVADNPGVAELPMRFDLDEPAIHGAVPTGIWLRLERERRPRLELELDDGQEPLREQYRVGERAPHLLRRVMQIEFERNGFGLRGGGLVGGIHSSIFSSSCSRRWTCSVQKA